VIQFPPVRFFRLSPGGVECDKDGLRVGDVALLGFEAKGGWTLRDDIELANDLSRIYGFPVDVGSKRGGLAVVAAALQSGNVAKAQVAALLLRLPEPTAGPTRLAREVLARDLVASGLLKAEDGWDEKSPRAGSPRNPARVVPKPKGDKTPAEIGQAPAGQAALSSRAASEALALMKASEIETPADKASPDDPKHPGWPAGAPNSQGGRFRPKTPDDYPSGSPKEKPNDPNADASSKVGLGWPPKAIGKEIRNWIAEAAARLTWRGTEALIDTIPYLDAFAVFLETMAPQPTNMYEVRLEQQLRANFGPPKTLEQLQTPPDGDPLGYERHHIVEQNDANVAKGDSQCDATSVVNKFGRDAIDADSNIVWIPRFKHEEITTEYNSKPKNGQSFSRLRDYVNTLDFDSQRQIGLEELRQYGVLK
jgi:hypothetical protein